MADIHYGQQSHEFHSPINIKATISLQKELHHLTQTLFYVSFKDIPGLELWLKW